MNVFKTSGAFLAAVSATPFALIAALVMTTSTVSAQSRGGRQLTADLTNPAEINPGTATFYVNVGQNTICHELNIPGFEGGLWTGIWTGDGYLYQNGNQGTCVSGLDQDELRHLISHPEEYEVIVEGATEAWTGNLEK